MSHGQLVLLAFLVFSAFLGLCTFYTKKGHWQEILWICHVSSILMIIGLLIHSADLIRIAILCITPGILLWLIDMYHTKVIRWESIISHIVSFSVGLYALSQMEPPTSTWWHALIWLLCVQLFSLLIRPKALNINLVHYIYPGMEKYFTSMVQYWIFNLIVAAGLFWSFDKLLMMGRLG